jgi:hypothetical protein
VVRELKKNFKIGNYFTISQTNGKSSIFSKEVIEQNEENKRIFLCKGI